MKGHEARLGGGEKDFSMLFTYACADNYLKDKGTLGFLITMEVFKSKGAGEGFRQFELKDKKVPLKVLSMEDMVNLQPFQSANKTSVFFMKKGEKTSYPVPVVEWKRKPDVGRIPPDWTVNEVEAHCEKRQVQAVPIDPNKPSSSWQTAETKKLEVYSKLKGQNPYKAHLGARVEPYGVFWLHLKEVRPDGILVIENMHERGKWEIKTIHAAIEPDLVFPAISGREIVKFGVKSHFYSLISQDPKKRCGYNEEYLSAKFPLTYAYLIQFKDILIKRAAYKKYFCKEIKDKGKVIEYVPFAPFYSQYNISELTFSRYKVVWKRMAAKMSAVVLSSVRTDFGTKSLVSTDTTAFFALDNKDEAHYLCAILNSDIINDFIKSFSSAGRGFGAPSVMNNFAIPRFDADNKLHRKLSELSEKAHQRVKTGKSIEDIEKEINTVVKKLWNIK